MKYTETLINKKVSKIGIGTGRFGTLVPETDAWDLLDFFYQNGGTVIDTARNYYEWTENGRGKSEECIGRWIEKRKNRQAVCITTKGGVKNNGHIWKIDLSSNYLLNELKQSLEALRTDYIDIYLLHRDEINRPIEEIMNTFQELKEYANISCIGVSNWSYERVMRANEYARKCGLKEIEIVQTWWSLAEYTKEMWNDEKTTHMENNMYDYMLKNEMTGMAYTSQCKGYFQKVVKYGSESLDAFLRQRIETPVNIQKAEYIRHYCDKENISPTSVVLGYITDNLLKGIALVSTSNMIHLEEIINCCDYVLPQHVINDLDEIGKSTGRKGICYGQTRK